VKQLGSDRIVDFEFGADDINNTYHIIAEFYAAVRKKLDGSKTIRSQQNKKVDL